MNYLDFLKEVDLFKNLDKGQVAVFLDICREMSFEIGNKLFGEGEKAKHIWIVTEGQIDLRFDLPGRTTSELNTISSIFPEKTLGWSSFVPPYKYRLSAYCAGTSCKTLRLEKESFVEILEKDSRIGYVVMSNLADIISSRFHQLQKSAMDSPPSMVKIKVHMGTCGIIAGAREIMGALMAEIASSDRQDIIVERAGCLGKCSTEPNVTVEIAGGAPVIYQKMTSDKMHQVFQSHILGGKIQSDFVLSS